MLINMWYAGFLRIIRRRLVLGLIFLLSLVYCLVNLIGNGGSFDLENNEFEVKREHPIIWQQFHEHNTSNDLTTTCRNSVQGKNLLVDDRGFVCSLTNILWTGCCNTEIDNQKQYSCDTCSENNCCSVYENCVACCLHPNKRKILEKVIAKASGRQVAVFASVKDHFELCLAKCRTDSHSVQHENKYRDPKAKHCYGETEAHESQREVIGNTGNQ